MNRARIAYRIFPHIENPSSRLLEVESILYNLLRYGQYEQTATSEADILFGILNRLSRRARLDAIMMLKQRVKLINKYRISNEQVILNILRLSSSMFSGITGITLKHKKLLSILAKNPLISINELAKKVKNSNRWVKKQLSYLRQNYYSGIYGHIDISHVNLILLVHYFVIDKDKEKLFLKLIATPYVRNSIKNTVPLYGNPYVYYIVTVYLPDQPKAKKLYQNWISYMLQERIVKTFLRIEGYGIVYNLNIDMFDGRTWSFDVNPSALRSMIYLRDFSDLVPPINPTVYFTFSYDRFKNLSTRDLYILGLLELNPRMTLKQIQERLRSFSPEYAVSIKTISKDVRRMKKAVYPILFLHKANLESTLYLILEYERYNREEEKFLLKYFINNYPVSFILFGKEGMFISLLVPTEKYLHVRSFLSIFSNYFTDFAMFSDPQLSGKRAFIDLVGLWNERRRYWIVEEDLFPTNL